MQRLIIMLLALPFWAYFPMAGGLGYVAEQVYQSALKAEAERAEALRQGRPELVDLTVFDRDTHVGPADEIYVSGWIDTDYNYNLIKRKNGVKTGERHMYVLFGEGDADGSRVARAALVLTTAEKERFVENLNQFLHGFGEQGMVMAFNGYAKSSVSYSSLARDAMGDENLTRSDDFVFIEPFFDGREAALAPQGDAQEMRLYGWGIALVVALFGVGKFLLRSKKGPKPAAPAAAMPGGFAFGRKKVPAPAVAAPIHAPHAEAVTADSPLGRITQRLEAEQAAEAATLAAPEPVQAERAPSAPKKFPIKLALVAVIAAAVAIRPNEVMALLPLLVIVGFWALVFGGINKVQALLGRLFPGFAGGAESQKAGLTLPSFAKMPAFGRAKPAAAEAATEMAADPAPAPVAAQEPLPQEAKPALAARVKGAMPWGAKPAEQKAAVQKPVERPAEETASGKALLKLASMVQKDKPGHSNPGASALTSKYSFSSFGIGGTQLSDRAREKLSQDPFDKLAVQARRG